jgi:lysine N6-hydroxylase
MVYDLIGIGIGPSNLGLAVACNDSTESINAFFLEKEKEFNWHPGMMLKESCLQVHYLKDLVTPVNPKSYYTFLSFLVENNKFYQFINRKSNTVSRKEYENYYRWTAYNLHNLHFDSEVIKVRIEHENFLIELKNGIKYAAKNISCGIGHVPVLPDFIKKYDNNSFFHSINYFHKIDTFTNKNVDTITIVGGGQSGAEIFYDLISCNSNINVKKIYWISDRFNMHIVQDGCFDREIFSPFYNRFFYNLPENVREKFIQSLHLSGDGIDPDLADNIYRKIYEIKHVNKENLELYILPGHRVEKVHYDYKLYNILIKNLLNEKSSFVSSNLIICATGFKFIKPDFLSDILPVNFIIDIDKNYGLVIEKASHGKIYFQNCAKERFGLADPYLSTSAWRNKIILSDILSLSYAHNEMPILSWE